jgi:uncharacterized protein with von Willebrand factor type A (vWA) domain
MAGADGDDVPDVAGIRDEIRSDLVTFVRALRRAGVAVPANAAVVAGQALVTVGFDDEERAHAALRAALVRRHRDIDRFDRMFPEFWRRLRAHLSIDGERQGGLVEDDDARPDGRLAPIGAEDAPEVEEGGRDRQDAGADTGLEPETTWSGSVAPGETEGDDGETVATATYSPAGQPERVTVTIEPGVDDGELLRSVGRLARALATERGRRWHPATSGERADVRRSLRQSVSAGGAIVSVPERERARTASRTVVLADVSRSVLDVLDRSFLVRWLRALGQASRDCRLFLFDDDIAEVTAAFEAESAQQAVVALRDAETAWGGGTRIGHAVTALRDDYPGTVDRRTTVLIVSDGLEMGDVSALETGMAWLSRRAAAVVWLNPLAAAPDYEPVADGMAAALPSVDGLFAFTGPDDVRELTRQLTRYGIGGAIGYEHDPRRARGTGDNSRGDRS